MPADRLRRVNLNFINPDFLIRVCNMLELCESAGASFYASSGYRSYAEQMKLYFQGRTQPGQKVTNALGGQSAHNFGIAMDFYRLKNGKVSWVSSDYDALGAAAQECNLHWGKAYKDVPHISLPGYVSGGELAPLDKVYKATSGNELDKLKEVWKSLDLTKTV